VTQVISTWNEDLKEKVRLVQLFLPSLYYNNLLELHLILDPIVASITDLERQPILHAFKARLGATDADLLPFWQRMIELLPIFSSDESEEALLIRPTIFQRFVTDAPPVLQGRSQAIRPVPKKPGRERHRRRGPAPVRNPAYLSFDVVRELFKAASFLLQQYGPRFFNTQITIPYSLFKFNSKKEEFQFLSEFHRQLRSYFKRWFDCEFHRLSVLENNEHLGLCSRLIIHVPNESAKGSVRLTEWLHDWKAEQRIQAPPELEIRVDSKRFSSTKQKVSYHWQCVRWLGRSTTSDWDVEGGHLAERCSLFIIIALGESVLVTGAAFAGLAWTPETASAFAVDFAGSVAMWWIYFDTGAERGASLIEASENPGRRARLVYTYIHLLIVAGIIVSAVADDLVLAHPAGHGHFDAIAVILGGPAIYLAGNALFKWAICGRWPLSHLAGLTMLIALISVAAALSALALGAVTSVILAIVAVWEWRSLRRESA
jgi:Bacterial low temperature requirement A protein (LtrA)